MVPFQISLQEAQEAFEAWHQSHWLAPGRLLRKGLGSMHAALLPFWIFETTVRVEYTGGEPGHRLGHSIQEYCEQPVPLLSEFMEPHSNPRDQSQSQSN